MDNWEGGMRVHGLREDPQPLQAIRATIEYWVNPWTDPLLVETATNRAFDTLTAEEATQWGDPRAIVRGSMVNVDRAVNPTANPHFWKEVRQLSFDFAGADWPKVRGFYRLHGPLGDSQDSGLESWAWAAAAANWFRGLTVLLEAVQSGRTDQIREFAGIVPTWSDSPWDLHPPHGLVLPSPQFEASASHQEIHEAAWKTVIEATTAELGNVGFAPISADLSNPKRPAIAWGFSPDGAFQAALIQWYFEKLAHVDLSICEASDCDNIIPPNRSKWCSDACRWRVTKRVQRRQKQGS